jgi:hypothetical protein
MSSTMSPTTTHAATSAVGSPKKTVQQIYGKLRKEYGFIPRDKLDQLLDEEMVKKILCEIAKSNYGEGSGPLQIDHFEPEKLYQLIHQEYKVILAILIDLSWEEMVVEFSRFANLNDSKLPFNEDQLKQVDDTLTSTEFSKRQYHFIMEDLKGCHAWCIDYVLPFVEDEIIGKGAFSDVYRVKIYPAYDKLKLPNCDFWPAVSKLKRVCC